MHRSRPPKASAPAVAQLLVRIPTATAPSCVPVRPVPGSLKNECFSNVQKHAAEHGGSLVCGWSIVEWPGVFLEAEFHGVWRSPDGELVDVTPNQLEVAEILFAPDPGRTFEGWSVNNVRHLLTESPEVRELDAIQNELFQIRAEHETPYKPTLSLTPAEARRLFELEDRARALRGRIRPYRPGRNEPCSCGSGAKYKKCCGASTAESKNLDTHCQSQWN